VTPIFRGVGRFPPNSNVQATTRNVRLTSHSQWQYDVLPLPLAASDMMIVSGFRAAQAAEIFLRPIRASAVERIGLFVIDPLHLKMDAEIVP